MSAVARTRVSHSQAADRRVVAHGLAGRSPQFTAEKTRVQTASVTIQCPDTLLTSPALVGPSRNSIYSATEIFQRKDAWR
jgi:hypothetical protein